MQKVNFKIIIKVVNICLGVVVLINFAYFIFAIIRESKKSAVKISESSQNAEFKNLITEFEENSGKIKDLVK